MPRPTESRFETARTIERMPRERVAGAVRFAASGYSIGWLRREGEAPVRILRFAVDCGQAVKIALSGSLSLSLGVDLVTGGERPRRNSARKGGIMARAGIDGGRQIVLCIVFAMVMLVGCQTGPTPWEYEAAHGAYRTHEAYASAALTETFHRAETAATATTECQTPLDGHHCAPSPAQPPALPGSLFTTPPKTGRPVGSSSFFREPAPKFTPT